MVVSPDHGGTTRARRLAEILHAPLAIIDKRRPKPNVAEAMNIIGDVNGKIAIVVDDIVDTAGTLTAGIQMLYDKGATAVYASCVHGVLSGPAIDRLKAANLEEFVCTNTIPQDDKAALCPVEGSHHELFYRTGYQGCGRKQTSQRNRCEIRRVSLHRNCMLEHFIEFLLPQELYPFWKSSFIVVITIGSLKAFITISKRCLPQTLSIRIELANALALGLEFKMGAEILKTVLVRSFSEIYILGAIILLRALLSLMIHFEIKTEKEHGSASEASPNNY